jgi:alanine racemase
VFTVDQAARLDQAAAPARKSIGVHVKIDTGMNRVGFRLENIEDTARAIADMTNIRVDGLMTHFAVADELEESAFTNDQISKFAGAVDIFLRAGHRPEYIDLANSPGAVVYPHSRSKMVRIGGLLFGITGDLIPKNVGQPNVQPVMSVYTEIALLKSVPKGESIGYGRAFYTSRDSVIATVPIGYNDGYDRALSNCGEMVVRSKPVPVVGRVSMDWVTIDVTDVPGVEVGDRVTVIGSEGEGGATAEDIARKIETISYEVTCGISPRVPRIYK